MFSFYLSIQLLCYIIDKQRTNGTPVVRTSYRSEVLLTSSVPYLQLDRFTIRKSYRPGCELHPQSNLVILVDLLLHKLHHHATLAHP